MPGALGPRSSSAFSLSSGDDDFKSRSNDIFSNLSSNSKGQLTNERDRRNRQSFKRPANPAPRSRHVPDFNRNPARYTKYDLSTVSEHTEKGNSAAAFSFLEEIKKRKEANQSDACSAVPSTSGCTDNKPLNRHMYAKPQVCTTAASTGSDCKILEPNVDEEKAVCIGSKLIMPEYVVGKDKKRVSTKMRESKLIDSKEKNADQLSLVHLNEDDKEDSITIDQEDTDSNHLPSKKVLAESQCLFKKSKRRQLTRKRTSQDE